MPKKTLGLEEPHVYRLLRKLTHRQRTIVWEHIVKGRTYTSISKELGVSLERVRQLERKGLARLWRFLQRSEETRNTELLLASTTHEYFDDSLEFCDAVYPCWLMQSVDRKSKFNNRIQSQHRARIKRASSIQHAPVRAAEKAYGWAEEEKLYGTTVECANDLCQLTKGDDYGAFDEVC